MSAGLGEQPSSRICRSTTLVKVQAFTGAGVVPCAQTREKFPVLVRVTAAAAAAESSVVGVDIVAVIDVGGGMSGAKLQRIKDAMKVVVNKLGPGDRLSIVSFDSDVRRLTKLTGMSDQGRIAARKVVNDLSTNGGANTGPRAAPPALDEGAQILRERRHDEKGSRRVGCIVFLSDALLDTQIISGASISSDFPVHALALGADHDPKAMKHIAAKTSGTYSFANNDLGKVKDACALFTSVPATSVEITLRAHEGALLSSDEKMVSSDDGGRSVAIRIDNMYAGEKKSFIVYLALQATEEREQKLLTIGGRYQNLSESKNLADTDVSVMRPQEKYFKTGNEHHYWAEVIARIKLFFMGICSLVPQPSTATTQAITSKLQQIWQHFCKSMEERKQKLLTLGGRYQNLSDSNDLADTDVSVMRPEEQFSKTGQAALNKVPHYWAGVVARIKLFFRGICSLVPQPSTATTQAITSKLQQTWQQHFCKSTEGKFKNAPQIMESFNQNMTRGINKVSSGLPLPYKFSWLRSHKWRRATTKNEQPRSAETGDFQTTPPQETEGIVQVQDGNDHGSNTTVATSSSSTTNTWGNYFRARGRNLHPCSRLFPGVAVVLFLASLLLMLLYSALQGTSMEKKNGQDMGLHAIYQVNPENPRPLLPGETTDRPAWEAENVTDESSSPGQGCCRDHADDATKPLSSSDAKTVSDSKCEGHGCGRDTFRESALVAKILDIIITSVREKEMELKALLVEAQYDHK